MASKLERSWLTLQHTLDAKISFIQVRDPSRGEGGGGGGGEIIDYNKNLTSIAGMFHSLEEIQAYIKECERKRLDLKNAGACSKAY